jgi:hypothetical protein
MATITLTIPVDKEAEFLEGFLGKHPKPENWMAPGPIPSLGTDLQWVHWVTRTWMYGEYGKGKVNVRDETYPVVVDEDVVAETS